MDIFDKDYGMVETGGVGLPAGKNNSGKKYLENFWYFDFFWCFVRLKRFQIANISCTVEGMYFLFLVFDLLRGIAMFGWLKKKKKKQVANYPLDTCQNFYNFVKDRPEMWADTLTYLILILAGASPVRFKNIMDLIESTRNEIRLLHEYAEKIQILEIEKIKFIKSPLNFTPKLRKNLIKWVK